MDESSLVAQPYVEIYEGFYRELNPGGAPTISAAEAAAFLRRSNLPVQALGQIWEIADFQKRGVLDKRGTFMAFKLVAAAQQGHPIHLPSLQIHNLSPPNFAGPRTGAGTPLSHHSPPQTFHWAISQPDQIKYDSIFDSLVPEDGKLPGAKVRPVLMNSGLNPQYLAKIWELADMDKDGYLDRIEMAVALHLVYRALQSDPIPSQLPPSLIHPSKAHLSRRQSVADSYVPNGIMRSRAGSMASLDGMTPSNTSQPFTNRSVSAQPYGHRASVIASPAHGLATPSDDWPVDKFSCAAQFAVCDGDSDGLVSGADVRPVLLSTGLQQQYLAHIWELADINKTGTLNQEQFALIVHLVNMKRRGEDLPMQLPSHLVPPSMRQLNLTGTSNTVGETSISEAALAQAAQSDNPEVRKLVEEMEKLLEERRETDAQVTHLEADMTVKNSTIRNLQIELQTLDSTVKQIERQKAEAARRLGQLDEQINQLEAAGVAQSARAAEASERLDQLKTDSEQGAASAERDQATIATINGDIAKLEAEARTLQAALIEEQRLFESSVNGLTEMEREMERDTRIIAQLTKETETVQHAMVELQQINSAEDAGEKVKDKMNLLSIVEKPGLLLDTACVTPSTSSQSGFNQPPDPFTNKPAAADPFANADPFAGGHPSDYEFPTDPFGGSAFPTNNGTGGNKPPPPRPVPPKTAASRQTPVATEDPFANTDPFASQASTGGTSAGFADFANFGSFN